VAFVVNKILPFVTWKQFTADWTSFENKQYSKEIYQLKVQSFYVIVLS